MPANFSDFKRLLENEAICPMCEQNVPPMSITLASDPDGEFKALTALMKESGPQDGNEDGEGEEEDEEDA